MSSSVEIEIKFRDENGCVISHFDHLWQDGLPTPKQIADWYYLMRAEHVENVDAIDTDAD